MIPTGSIPQDPVLPQLSQALDPGRMARAFEDRFAELDLPDRINGVRPVRVEDCRIERVKYKPGYNCLVYYRLTIRDASTGTRCEQVLCGRFYEAGCSLSHYLKANRQPVVSPVFGAPLLHIEPLEMVAWAFPNDRKLDGLPAITDSDRLREELLPPVVAARWGLCWQIRDAAWTLMHFVPEHTCCVRVELELEHGVSGETRPWTIFGKTYYNSQGEEAYGNMRWLWESPACRDGALSIPRPLGYQAAHRVLWQEGLAGETMLAVSRNGRLDRVLVEQTARAVAAMQSADIECPSEIGLESWMDRFDSIEAFLGGVRPSCAPVVSALVRRFREQAAALDDGATAILHSDLHPKNIMVDGDEVSIIDLDDITRGPPLLDIGSFIATLLTREILNGAPVSAIGETVRTFVETYRANVPWQVTPADLAWFVATALIVERGFRSVTRLKAGRMENLDALIALADEISQGKGAGAEVIGHG